MTQKRFLARRPWSLAGLFLISAAGLGACGGDGDGGGDGGSGAGSGGSGSGGTASGGNGSGSGGENSGGDGGAGGSGASDSGGGNPGTGGTGDGPVLDVRLSECATDADALQLQFEYASGWEDQGDCDVPFLSKWDTAQEGVSSNVQIKLPLVEVGSYDFWIDWGDGSVEHISEWDDAAKTHTYEAAGEYDLRVIGEWEGFSFSPNINSLEREDAQKLLLVSQWGGLSLGSVHSHFLGASNLQLTATDAPDLSNTASLHNCFALATAFNSDIGHWDVSNITRLSGTFAAASSFEGGGIENWDVSNVTNMSSLFADASNFNADISGWETTQLEQMTNTFQRAVKFNRDIGKWRTPKLKNLASAFIGATSFNQDLSGWDVSNVEYFLATFRNATSFNGDIGGWTTSSGTTMTRMFSGATSFTQDISGWDVTGVTDMEDMLDKTALSSTVYSRVLSEWSKQAVQGNVVFGADGLSYSEFVVDARNQLINVHGWTISGDSCAGATCP